MSRCITEQKTGCRLGLVAITCLLHFVIYHEPAHAQQDEQQAKAWIRHTIDNRSRGADGVRLGDVNGDGHMDIVTGWEEGGITRLYLNPGPEKSKEKWPAVTVGKTPNVEDAVLVDLDGDGALDVVSSCEGKTKTMFVHWAPKDKKNLLDPAAWETQPIPATVGKQMWMYCLPMQVDAERGIDLVVGSKGKGAAVGWLESPQDPRDLDAWTYHKLRDAGWIMSLERSNPNSREPGFLVTDRKGQTRAAYILYREPNGDWQELEIESGKSEYMFAHSVGRATWFVATRDGLVKRCEYVNYRDKPRMEITDMPNPFDIKNGKAVAVGDLDGDTRNDVVISFNTQGTTGKPGVAWIEILGGRNGQMNYRSHDISGREGKKFDRIELIDLDGDGDLDVLTCEEADNLGVIWYENPLGDQ